MSSNSTDRGIRPSSLDEQERLMEKPATSFPLPLRTILAMACGMGGLQVVWSTIFANGTLYLHALGLSDTWTSLIWAIPATCGCFVQPFVGASSDISTHDWGRRRPYIAVGALGTTIFIFVLAWAGSLGHLTANMLSTNTLEQNTATFTAAYAVFGICMLSLAIQPLQVALRAIMLDQCPAHQQLHAQSWVTRLSGIGQILGSAAGLLYIPDNDPDGQIATFRIISAVAILAVAISAALTCASVPEQPATKLVRTNTDRLWFLCVVRGLARSFSRTSWSIRRVFVIQLLAWMGWFGFLFYNTSYITTIYFAPESNDTGSKISGYIASFVMLLFSCVSLATSALLPPLITWIHGFCHRDAWTRLHRRSTTGPESVLLTVWSGMLGVSAALVLLTSITSNFKVATAFVALNGVSWATTNWIPFALIGRLTAEGNTNHPRDFKDAGLHPNFSEDSSGSGSISGLHNIAISAPQIVAASICAVILWVAEVVESPYGAGWVLRAAGFAYFAASCVALCSRAGIAIEAPKHAFHSYLPEDGDYAFWLTDTELP